jgi:hypothetical protein
MNFTYTVGPRYLIFIAIIISAIRVFNHYSGTYPTIYSHSWSFYANSLYASLINLVTIYSVELGLPVLMQHDSGICFHKICGFANKFFTIVDIGTLKT